MSFLVLVVDDEPNVELLFRQQFRRDLRDNRFRMDFAQSAASAHTTVPEHMPSSHRRYAGWTIERIRADARLTPSSWTGSAARFSADRAPHKACCSTSDPAKLRPLRLECLPFGVA
jgi:transposase